MTFYNWTISAAVFLLALIGPSLGVTEEVQLRPGESYKIVRPVYLMAVYESMDDRRTGKSPARAYLQPEQYTKTRWVAFQCEVPVGTVMTIIRPAPPAKDLWHRYAAYYVELMPSSSGQLEVIVQLFRGFADTSGRLNVKFFEPVSRPNDMEYKSLVGCVERK